MKRIETRPKGSQRYAGKIQITVSATASMSFIHQKLFLNIPGSTVNNFMKGRLNDAL